MKKIIFLIFIISNLSGFYARGQAPALTANDYVRPYTEAFQYGTNLGYYNNTWNDEALAGIAQTIGGHSVRPTLPEYFVAQYGYSIRASTFAAYTNNLGMKEITCFVEGPSNSHRDWTVYPGCTGPSKLFSNLYEPIWNADGSVNANNYYASYLYQLLLVYGNKVRFWEVINEPDFTSSSNQDNWLTTAPQPSELANLQAPVYNYIRMLRISYEVVKKYHPEAYVTTGGVGYPQFVDALLRYTDNPNSGAVTAAYPRTGGAYLDALSYHSYPSYSLHYWDNSINWFRYTRTSDYAASKVMADKQAITNVLNKYGYNDITHPAKVLLVSESNIGRRTSDDRTGSDEMQRNFGIKTLVLAQKNDIKQLYLYSLGEAVNAPATGQSVSGSDEIGLMGLYENLNRDVPGKQRTTQLGKAFATTSRLLYGYSYDAARTAALALPSGAEGAAFSKNGSYIYVLWAKALVDNSEAAWVSYTFPAAWNLNSVLRYDWDYSVTSAQTSQAAQNISLSGTPAFFSEGTLTPFVTTTTAPTTGTCTGTGTLLREQWNNIGGNNLTDIPLSSTPSSSAALTQFEATTTTEYNYGARLRGYICPPQSGTYTFWLTGDDASVLYLSPDEDPTHKVSLATCAGWTSSPQDYYRYPSQQSASVTLVAGQRYYVEALHKQAWGPGYISVAWQLPDGSRQLPIPGNSLIPFVSGSKLSGASTSSAIGKQTTALSTQNSSGTTPDTFLTALAVYPNPFSKKATVQFSVNQSGPATVALYNMQGQYISQLFSGTVEAGVQQSAPLEMSTLSSGLYLVRLTTKTNVVNQKVSYTNE